MRITSRTDYERTFTCMCCGLTFRESEITSEDVNGNDECPACNGIDFEEEGE